MATSFKKTVIKTIPRVGETITTDTLFWKNLEVPVTKKEYGPITHIDFSPVEPHNFAVTNSSRIQVYSPNSLQVIKVISRFKEQAHCGSFRDDGRLIVAGSDEGAVKLFDVDGKSLLRVFKGHNGSVHVTKFLPDRIRLFSGSDDNKVCVWDIPSETELISFKDHEDYVRCGIASMASKDILLTGSYDHTVKMWDTRTSECALSVNHGHPVESVLMFPSGGIFLSAELNPQEKPITSINQMAKIVKECRAVNMKQLETEIPQIVNDANEILPVVIGKNSQGKGKNNAIALEVKVGDMILTNLDRYADEWPQVAQVLDIHDEDITVQWYKGSKSSSWNPCTIPMPGQRGKRMPWKENINLSDIWLSGFVLTNKQCLPKNVRNQIDNFDL